MRAAASFAVGVVLLLGVGCSGNGDDARSAKVFTDSGTEIAVRVGDEFVISLESNPSTGYAWSVSQKPAGVRLVRDRYVAPPHPRPGSPGHQELRFVARATGSGTIELAYARSFEPDEPPERTASFPVTVR
ncbi:MAG: protease inhibitor I42 family protein [Acidimicrobiia bacterium]